MIVTPITQTLQELDAFLENINRLTEVVNIQVVKSLRLRNINRQLFDLITQCEAVKKFSDNDVREKQAMGNTNQRHIHLNSKSEAQIKCGKLHWTKMLMTFTDNLNDVIIIKIIR